jgi:Protein of unknown function (DUF2793)/Chaperone of endosialidase
MGRDAVDATSNLSLPFIVAAQAQKHVTHNEALRALDAIVQLGVLDKDLGAPPGSPVEGARYIVGAAPSGAWAGQAAKIAAYQDGAWAFYAPRPGWLAWVTDENRLYAWDGSAWAALPAGSLGSVADDPAPQLGGDLDANGHSIGFDDGTGITDASGNAQLAFHAAASAVNHLGITNAATASGPRIAAEGPDPNIDLHLASKGTGVVRSDGQLFVSSSAYPPLSSERTSGSTNTALSPHRLLATSSGDMVDGFGPVLGFSIRDNAGVINEGIATVRALRSGADNSGRLQLTTLNAGVELVGHEIAPTGQNYFPNVTTTASAANAVLNSGSTPANELLRSTSSRRYKREIEDLDDPHANNILKLRPVWYRSAIPTDRQDWSHYGLIAEEVADIDPRLVHWGYRDEDWETVDKVDNDSQLPERRLRNGAKPTPDGVAYDRLTVLLLKLVKRQQAWIDTFRAVLNE